MHGIPAIQSAFTVFLHHRLARFCILFFLQGMLKAGADAVAAARNASRVDDDGRPETSVTSPNGTFVFKALKPLNGGGSDHAESVLMRVADHWVQLPGLRSLPNDTVLASGALPRNPHRAPRNNHTIETDVLSISMMRGNGSELHIQDLAPWQRVNFSIAMAFNGVAAGKVGACAYWSDVAEDWATDGCDTTAFELSPTGYVNCSCNHLTDFAGTVGPASTTSGANSGTSAAVIGGAVGGALGFAALVAIGALIFIAVRRSHKRRAGAVITSTPSQATPASVV
jgi:hypothetical protein